MRRPYPGSAGQQWTAWRYLMLTVTGATWAGVVELAPDALVFGVIKGEHVLPKEIHVAEGVRTPRSDMTTVVWWNVSGSGVQKSRLFWVERKLPSSCDRRSSPRLGSAETSPSAPVRSDPSVLRCYTAWQRRDRQRRRYDQERDTKRRPPARNTGQTQSVK